MAFDDAPDGGDHHGGRGVRAEARRVPGPHPYLHRGGAEHRHSGSLHRRPFPSRRRRDGAGAGHAWAEAYVPGLGWIAFDAANGICATDAHVRVAVGLDYLGAAPVRGTRFGGGGEALDVAVRVSEVGGQRQSQGQARPPTDKIGFQASVTGLANRKSIHGGECMWIALQMPASSLDRSTRSDRGIVCGIDRRPAASLGSQEGKAVF